MHTHFRHLGRTTLALAACTLIGTSLAYAQAPRTWVSGVGDDVNPCSRTAPCKTFAGAISKTATGGEISVLDPGGYGAVTITKAITINGDGTLASISAALVTGIIINAPNTAAVTIRNISINGMGTGLTGIRFIGGASLTIERCDISGFTQAAVDVEPAQSAKVVIRDSSLRTATTGVQISEPSGNTSVALQNVLIKHTVNGVEALGAATTIANSTITQNSTNGISASAGQVNVENSMITHNGTGAVASGTSTVRLSNNGVYGNLTQAFACAGSGALLSTGDNRVAGNTGGGCVPTPSVPVQ